MEPWASLSEEAISLVAEDIPDPGQSSKEESVREEEAKHAEHFHLSSAAFHGQPSPCTLYVAGKVKELNVNILIDSSSSHNILQPQVVEFLGLPLVAIKSFSIIVGHGNTIQCFRCCPDVPVIMAGQVFPISFHMLPIHGTDLVLGVQWLQTLGIFLFDFSIPSIQFSYQNKLITLIGTTHNTSTHASYSQFCIYIYIYIRSPFISFF